MERSGSYPASHGSGTAQSAAGPEPSSHRGLPSSQSMQPFPQQQSVGGGASGADDLARQRLPLQSPDQGQVHRRTQSLRPLSAFQPLENGGHPQQGGGGGGGGGDSAGSPRPPSPTGSTSRSIRTAAAPLTFKSPELRSALSLQEAQSRKIYMEGYLSKREHLSPDGKALHVNDPKKRWQLCFVQLLGTVLSVWSVQQMEAAARQGTEVPPAYINVTDSFVDFVGTISESPQEVPGSRGRYENVFAVNTAGHNRIIFGVEGQIGRRLVQAWVNAIRLATWEKVRLEEIYTGSLVRARLGAVSAQQATSGPGGAPGDVDMAIKSPLSKNGRMEGSVKARFMGSTEWKKCWLVLADSGAEATAQAANDGRSETGSVKSNRNSFWSRLKAGDRSSILGSPSVPSLADTGLSQIEPPPGSNGAPGLAYFYESKKAKKPFATLAFAAHAFAVYPSRPELVEGSSLFKVEGAFPLSDIVSATNRKRQSGWVMIMPEIDSSSNKGANAEMMKWCIAFMDAFRLYGRPTQLQWDARNPISPFFAYPIGPYKDRLFLDRELAEFLDIREERHLANRANLHGIMSARMRGERTPILPPLPQPNAESARQLNATAKGAASSASTAPQLPPAASQPQLETDSSTQGEQSGEYPAHASLPPLNTGQAQGGMAGDFRSSQLSSIGERSREGSTITTFAATPSTAHPTEANGMKTSFPTGQSQLSRASSQIESAPTTAPVPVPAPAPTTNGATATAAPVHQKPSPPSVATTPPPPPPSSEGKPSANVIPASASAAAPIPIMNNANTRRTSFARKDSDTLESYDEGILNYINSIGESLPTVSPKNPRRAELSSTGSSNQHSRSTPTAGFTTAAVAADGPVGAKTNDTASSKGQVPLASNTQPVAPSNAAAQTGANPRISVLATPDGFDQDAFAASSYLDRPASPPTSNSNAAAQDGSTYSRSAQNASTAGSASSSAPVAAGLPAPASTTYPSSFGANKKAQERKLAAQAQAKAQQDALAKPGRPDGAKSNRMSKGPRHAWGDDDEEEGDDDDDDDEEDESVGVPAAVSGAGRLLPQQQHDDHRNRTTQQPSTQVQQQQELHLQQPQQQHGHPSYYQQQSSNAGRTYPYNNAPLAGQPHLAAGQANSARGSSPAASHDSVPRSHTFVQLNQGEQPGPITTAFQPQGLLQAGDQDKQERSAKQQEAEARAMGGHLVGVDSRPPEPQAGLLGAISAHERDRKKEGGLGATLTERERERVAAERRQREEDMVRMQQQQQQQQQQQRMMAAAGSGAGGAPGMPPTSWGPGMPPFNPMMWHQMQMMSMMNPMMFGGGGGGGSGPGSQIGHGGPNAPGSPDMQAQMRAAQAAQQAYMQALQQGGAGMGGGITPSPSEMGMSSPQMPPMSMGMMPFNPYMSMYGAPMGFPAWGEFRFPMEQMLLGGSRVEEPRLQFHLL